nr:SURF1 family cytochrome oxidase biogenesis protein [Serinicoccus sp. CUA-874]
MWQVLRRPRWLGYLVLAVVFGVVTAGLGAWQWQRHESKVERRAVVEANYGGDPAPVDAVLPGGSDLGAGQRWTRVSATGTYLSDEQHLVRNRPHQASTATRCWCRCGWTTARCWRWTAAGCPTLTPPPSSRTSRRRLPVR